jgi:hypothetical protein
VNQKHGLNRFKWIALSAVLMVIVSGCKPINQFFVRPMIKPTGDAITLLAEAHIVPYAFTTDDLEMGCVGAEASTALVMSFSRVTEEPHELGTLLYTAAGACEEERAFQKELEYLRYIRLQMPDMAQDALIAQKNHHIKAAKRFLKGWQELLKFNDGKEIGGVCPRMEQDFDELIWFVGIAAGLQALNHDILSGVGIGVPKNIAAQAERALGCIDNKKWFGIPMSIKAAVWTLLPGALPEGEDNWARLEEADLIGEKARVRLPHMIHLLSAYAKGDTDRVRKVIKRHVEQIDKFEPNQSWRLLDAIGTNGVLRFSDRMWTEAVGHRTPVGGLGTFWDENAADNIDTVDLDDLF